MNKIIPSPYKWNIGRYKGNTSCWSRSVSTFILRSGWSVWQKFATKLLWVKATPFGKPVVPLEYGSKNASFKLIDSKVASWFLSKISLYEIVLSGMLSLDYKINTVFRWALTLCSILTLCFIITAGISVPGIAWILFDTVFHNSGRVKTSLDSELINCLLISSKTKGLTFH